MDGINQLSAVFSKCLNFNDQLQLFATKGAPIMKSLLSGLDPHKLLLDSDSS